MKQYYTSNSPENWTSFQLSMYKINVENEIFVSLNKFFI